MLVRIAGRCTVFAESDMIHKQQMGHKTDDILYGLCQALVRNYLNNVALGKEILSQVVFQGGVAFNQGIIKALGETLDTEIIVPPHHELMGAIGVALLIHEEMGTNNCKIEFKGFEVSQTDFHISVNGKVLARWGGHCDRWEGAATG